MRNMIGRCSLSVAGDGHVIRCGGRSKCPMMAIPGAKQSTNGGQSWRLAGGECGGILPRGGEKSSGKGKATAAGRFYSWRRERGDRGPACRRRSVDGWPVR
jgi:hypothetical protein